LKSFSFTSFDLIHLYDYLIVPMIRRMVNLEDLQLYLTLYRPGDGCMDAEALSDHLLNHLPQLRRFTFHIQSTEPKCSGLTSLPTSEAFRRNFGGRDDRPVVATVHNDPGLSWHVCRIYSLPYEFHYFFNLNHCFGGGPFQKVRLVTMRDRYPFDEALFRIISRDMPLLERLMIENEVPPRNKPCSPTPLVFARLESVDLARAHDDYVELFLSKRRSSLPRLKSVRIGEQILKRIKAGLYSDSAHINLDGVLVRGAWRHFFF
jgi:hypothetical protein